MQEWFYREVVWLNIGPTQWTYLKKIFEEI